MFERSKIFLLAALLIFAAISYGLNHIQIPVKAS